jgi:hypothetical protein
MIRLIRQGLDHHAIDTQQPTEERRRRNGPPQRPAARAILPAAPGLTMGDRFSHRLHQKPQPVRPVPEPVCAAWTGDDQRVAHGLAHVSPTGTVNQGP